MKEEWAQLGADEPVQQGDLLLARDPKSGQIIGVCMVITADCDIANNKFGKQLACLRVAALHEYLRKHWAEKKLRKIVDSETEKIRAKLTKWVVARDPSSGQLSAEAVTQWIKRCDAKQICRELNIPEADFDKEQKSVSRFRSAVIGLSEDEAGDAFCRLVNFKATAAGRPREDCMKETVRQVKGEPLQEDIFLLPTLPQLIDFGPAVVLLRELIGIPVSSICFRSSDAESKDNFLRIGTPHPTIKYAVSQAFGILYTRIGLPESFENQQRAAIDLIDSFEWK